MINRLKRDIEPRASARAELKHALGSTADYPSLRAHRCERSRIVAILGKAIAPGLVAVVLAGCMTPVGVKKKPNTEAVRHSDPTGGFSPTPVQVAANGEPSADRLIVNSESVSAAELWKDIAGEVRLRASEMSEEDHPRYIDRRAAQLLTDKVAEMLLYQTASLRLEDDMRKIVDKYVDQEIRKIVTDDHGGVQGRYERFLAQQGRTLDDARRKLRRELIIASYLEDTVKPKVAEPTRSELLKLFEDHRDEWRRPQRKSMSLIEVRVLDRLPADVTSPSREQQAEARNLSRAKIMQAQAEVKGGGTFSDVARKFSDGSRATAGGVWGWITPGSVTERYAPAVEKLYALRSGEVSDILETPDGFFLVRCDESDDGFEPTFENVQQRVKERHHQIEFNKLVGRQIDELSRKARIEPSDLSLFHAALVATAPTFK